MAKKAFEIQSSDLVIGGVNLSAGATTIVIPGVTQATNYFVEEVDETGEQTNALNLPIVIDNVTHVAKVADSGANVSAYATYTVELDDEDYIDEIKVNTAGTYVGSEVDRNGDFDMWGYTGSDAVGYLTNWVTGDWVQIPFRPKMRAGDVENVGGGGVVNRSVEFPAGEAGDVAGVLASDSGTLYYSTGVYTDVNDIDKLFEVETTENYEVGQSGGTLNSIRILAADYPGIKNILDTLNNTNTNYQTDFTVDGGGDFGGAQTVTQVSYNGGTTIDLLWPHRTGVDPTTIEQGDTFMVEYIGSIPQPAIWTRILSSDISVEIYPNSSTELTVANKDFEIRTTRNNPGQDADIGIYAADDLWLEAAGDDVVISAGDEVRINSNNENSSYEWKFDATGKLHLPEGGDIVDSNGVSVLGGSGSSVDQNIWIETFASDAPTTDFVQGATSVEYDADGNVIALFSHYEPDPDSSYTSVAKLTPTGAVLWQVRFGANLNTDGWGLAYDTVDNIVYVAGRTSGTPLTYEFATLTKLNGTFGNIIWSKTYDFEADSQSAVVDVDGDGNPVMVGYSSNGTDNYIITTKVDKADGTVLWSKTLDGQGDDEAYGMAVGPANEIVTIGYTSQLGVIDAAATLYTEPASNPNWTSPLSVYAGGVNFTVTFTGGVPTFTNVSDTLGNRTVDDVLGIISGGSIGGATPADDMTVKVATLAANDTDDRMVVVKYAADGTIAWQKAVQFDAGYNCSGADADIDSAGNIYVCGQYQYDLNPGTTSAMSLVKFNSSGVKQWSRRVVGNCDTFGNSVVVGDDDQLYLSGITANNNASEFIWVVAKYNTDGVVTWQRLIDNTTTWTFGGTFWFGGAGGGSNIAVKNGYVVLAGAFGDPGTQPKAVVVQIDTDATLFSVGDWDIKGASFSGLLNGSASDITVVDANKEASSVGPAVGTFASGGDTSNFLTITRYGLTSGDSSLVNGAYIVTLGNTGAVTLPAGGTITEGYVTSNPTIQLTPASPDVASQKLVIKGGGAYTYTDNGIEINYNNNTAIVGDTLTFYVYSTTYTGQTLYWWIYPQGAGIGDTESGAVVLTGNSGSFSILVDSDDYEFTVRVSPEADNYDPANVGVESGLINAMAPTFDSEHHLHLTTGNLAETSIFLGTDDHNVRTTVNGGIEITTPNDTNNVWQFDTTGDLTVPGNIRSEGNIQISSVDNLDIVGDGIVTLRNNSATNGIEIQTDDGGHSWNFGVDGTTTFPSNKIKTLISSNISIETESLPTDPPATIVISGADFTAVNLTYTKDGSNSIWYPAGYNPANDPYIEFTGGQYGIRVPGFGQALYVNTGTLNVPLAQWNTNPPLGSVAPTGVYTYPGTYTRAWTFGANSQMTFPQGTVLSEFVSGPTNTFGIYANTVPGRSVTIRTAPGSVSNKDWTFGPDGSLTLPGAVVKSTVARTSFSTPVTLNDSTYLTAIVDGSYGPFTRGEVVFTVVVTSGVAAYTITSFNTSRNYTLNEVIGTLDAGDLGGTPGNTSNIAVASVTPSIVALDLTKTVNKLTTGQYTLADGVEGQTMYLVPQNGTDGSNVSVSVANSRITGVAYTGSTLLPFKIYNGVDVMDNTGICTLIFTDGAWQQQGGAWD